MADTEIGSLIVRMKADLSDYEKKLDAMEKNTAKTSDKVANAFKKVADITAVTGAALATFAAMAIKSAMEWGKAVDDLSDKTGMAGEKASELLAIAKRAGISTQEANMMFSRFSRAVYNAADAMGKASAEGKTSDDVLSRLGVTAVNSNGTMRETIEIFQDIKDKLNGMADGWQKSAIEMELFGRSGTNMHDMLHMTREEMQATIEKAKAMGLIISSETAQAWEQFERNLNSTKGVLTSVGITIGNELLPELQRLLNDVQGLIKAFVALDPQTRSNILSVVKLGAEIGIACAVINRTIGALSSAAAALGIMRAATLAAVGPWIALAAAIWLVINALDAKNQIQGYNPKTKAYLIDGAYHKEVEEEVEVPGGSTANPSLNPNATRKVKVTRLQEFSEDEYKKQWKYDEARRKAEEFDADAEANKLSTGSNQFIGGGGSGDSGGGGSDAKTAFQQYQEEFQKAQQEQQSLLEIGKISGQDYLDFLKQQLEYVDKISVGEDEAQDKRILELGIQKQIQAQQRQIFQEEREAASQKVQLGQMTIEQYVELLKKQLELTTNDKDRLALAVQLHQENEKLLDQQAEMVDRSADAKKSALDLQQERAAHDLKMLETYSAGTDKEKADLLAEENELARKNLEEEYAIESAAIDKKLELYANDKEKYADFLEQKRKLDAKYQLNKLKLEDDYAEKVAAREKSIIDANNSMISDLILNTKSGHDVLQDMWTDFVKQVVAKLFSIKASTNIFSALFGNMFGLNSSSGGSGGGSVPSGVLVAEGGYISGPGSDTSDSIPSMLSNGEYVIKASSVRKYGKDYFDLLNFGKVGKFAAGGLVYSGPIIPNSAITSGATAQQGGQTVNNVSNVTVQQTFSGQQDSSVVAQIKASIPYIKTEIRNAIQNETSMRNAVKGAAG